MYNSLQGGRELKGGGHGNNKIPSVGTLFLAWLNFKLRHLNLNKGMWRGRGSLVLDGTTLYAMHASLTFSSRFD